MRISVDLELSPEDERRLASVMNCDEDTLVEALKPYARAALKEYTTFFLGQRVFTRGGDFREFRLFLLIKEAFQNDIPSEQKVSVLFQTTPSQSRALIRSVMSKYQYELQEAIGGTLKNLLLNASRPEEDGDYEVTVNNRSVVDLLNQTLSNYDDGSIPRVMIKTRSVSTYTMKPSAYQCLCKHFGVEE